MTEADRTNLAALFTLAWHRHIVRVVAEPGLWSIVKYLPTFDVVLEHIGGEPRQITVPPTRCRRAVPITDDERDAVIAYEDAAYEERRSS